VVPILFLPRSPQLVAVVAAHQVSLVEKQVAPVVVVDMAVLVVALKQHKVLQAVVVQPPSSMVAVVAVEPPLLVQTVQRQLVVMVVLEGRPVFQVHQ
jgi:hypothetical protein